MPSGRTLSGSTEEATSARVSGLPFPKMRPKRPPIWRSFPSPMETRTSAPTMSAKAASGPNRYRARKMPVFFKPAVKASQASFMASAFFGALR